MPAYTVLGDQPCEDGEDQLGFHVLARELTGLIRSSAASTPFTIGIEASWGRGKSSLMKTVERELKRDEKARPRVDTVWFNAWTAEGQDVLEGLVKSVLQAMDPNILRKALRRGKLLSIAKIPVLIVASWLRVGALVNEAWDALSADARTRNQVNVIVRDAMAEWTGKAAAATPGVPPDRLLVVFIDDLDRCSPENVLKVFEGLKLYLDARGFVFVIGYDEGIVTEAVVDRKRYMQQATGLHYVEKIVQIVFRIPQPTPEEVERLLASLLAQSGTEDLFKDAAARTLVIERNGRNPRRIKRFVNRFVLDYQLDESAKDLKPELLIKLLIFETYFPEFARLFTVSSETKKNPIKEFLDLYEAREALRRGDREQPIVAEVFESYKVAPAADPQGWLEQLEREATEELVPLVRDGEFVSLAESCRDPADQELILAKVQRRLERVVTETAEVRAAPEYLSGRTILWIDDNPESNDLAVKLLLSAGAEVNSAPSSESAAAALAMVDYDLLISDISREGRPEEGFDALKDFRDKKTFEGPAIFFTARISAARRERAKELSAEIVSNQVTLLRTIGELLPQPAAAVPA